MLRARAVSRLAAHRQTYTICRGYSQALELESQDRSSRNQSEGSKETNVEIGRDDGPNSIYVRTWNNPRNSLDSLAIIQYLENAFGPVDEFRTFKYGDRMSAHISIRFRDYASAARACQHNGVFQIAAPPPLAHSLLEGGMSLAEITPLLEAKTHDAEFVPSQVDTDSTSIAGDQDAPELLSFTVKATGSIFHHNPLRRLSRGMPESASRSFVKWSGFADIQPMPSGTLLDGQGEEVDHPNMRIAVRRYAKHHRMRNPLVIEEARSDRVTSPTDASQLPTDSIEEDWEPLDLESATPDTTAPSISTSIESSLPEATIETSPSPAPQTAPAPVPPDTPAPLPKKTNTRANTRQATAQLKAAGDILRKLNQKQQVAKAPAAPVVPPQPEKRKQVKAKKPQKTSFLEAESSAFSPSADASSKVAGSGEAVGAGASQTVDTSASPKVAESGEALQTDASATRPDGTSKPSPAKAKEQGVTSRLRSFVGNWF